MSGHFRRAEHACGLVDRMEVLLQRKERLEVQLHLDDQRGVATMPFSLKENEMKENLDIWKFTLDEGDMAEIEKLDKGHHYLRPGDWFGLPLWD